MPGGWLLCQPSLDRPDVGAPSRPPLHDAVLWRAQIADVANSAVVIFEQIAPAPLAPLTVVFRVRHDQNKRGV
jgi:hypothetical protein